MNTSAGISESSPNPTGVRHQIIGITTLVAFTMYLDRICIAEIAKLDDFRNTLLLSEKETGAILSAFFFTYALGQVPAGMRSVPWAKWILGARGQSRWVSAPERDPWVYRALPCMWRRGNWPEYGPMK